MHPRALIADVGHLEKVGIEPGAAEHVSKQRAVGQRRAAGDNDPVQILPAHLLGYVFHTVLRTRIQVGLGMGDAGQCCRVLGNAGHVEETADVRTAVANEHADPQLLLGDITLGGKLGFGGQREPSFAEAGRGRGRGPAGFDDRLGNVFRLAEGADCVDPGPARLERVELWGVAEAVLVEFDTETTSKLLD